jgi:DNA-directed RNA polymerase subunit beta
MQAVVRKKNEQLESNEPNSRIEKKKTSEAEEKIRLRLVPIWARILIVFVLAAAAAVAGTLIGYSVIGDGKASDVFDKSTWTHISDLVNKDTTGE